MLSRRNKKSTTELINAIQLIISERLFGELGCPSSWSSHSMKMEHWLMLEIN
jgi:hypothetical protein